MFTTKLSECAPSTDDQPVHGPQLRDQVHVVLIVCAATHKELLSFGGVFMQIKTNRRPLTRNLPPFRRQLSTRFVKMDPWIRSPKESIGILVNSIRSIFCFGCRTDRCGDGDTTARGHPF